MSQWRDVLKMMQNATGGWITTHAIYDELGVKNPSQRIEEIERYTEYGVDREVVTIKGKRAARYKLRASGSAAHGGTVGASSSLGAATPPEPSSGALFDTPPENQMWKAA